MNRLLHVLVILIVISSSVFAQIQPYIRTYGTVGDGDVVVFQGTDGKGVRSSGGTNALAGVAAETAARIGADTALSNLIAAIPGAVAVNTNNLIAGITNNAANITSEVARAVGAESALSNSVSTNVTALLAQITNKVAKTGDTMTGQLTIKTNLSINAAGTQWYIGSAPDQFWLGNAQIADWSGGLVFDATNYDLKIDGAFIGSAAKLTSFPAILATLAALGAEITNRIGSDTALSNGLAGVGAGATSLVSAAKTDASNQFVNVGGDTMTGPLVASNIYSVGAMTISADGVLTLDGGDGILVEAPITFEEPLTGLGLGLSGIPISGVSGLSTALESKVSSVAILPSLTIADRSSVSTNLTSLTSKYSGSQDAVVVYTGSVEWTVGKTYSVGIGLSPNDPSGTSVVSIANVRYTNSVGGTMISNYFKAISSTGIMYLTIASAYDRAQIVTNLYVREITDGDFAVANDVWVGGDAHVGGDILAVNYSHDMPLLTNATAVSLGLKANANFAGTSIGGESIATNYGTAIGYIAKGVSYGAAVGAGANASTFGSAVGYAAFADSFGVAVGHYSRGNKTNIAIGAYANSRSGSERISIGHGVTNEINNSAAIRGTLYLDGGTGILYRSTFGSGAWTLFSGSGDSPNLAALSNGVNSWLASSNDLAVVTNDYPAGTLGIVASSDGGTTLYLKAEATAGAELDPIAGALGTNNALSIQAVGVVATNALTWAEAGSNEAHEVKLNLAGVSNAIIKGATVSAAAADAVTTNSGILTITWNTNLAHDGTSAGGATRTNTWSAVTPIQQDAGATCWVVRGLPVQLVVASNSPTTISTKITDTNVDATTWLQIRAGTNTVAWGSGIQSTGTGASTTYVGRADTSVVLIKPAHTNLSELYQLR